MYTRARGHLTQVQEQRFRIATTDGPNVLLTLGHDAPVDGADLQRMLDDRADVIVDYEGEPGLSSGLAHAIRRV
jgi:hypothetical protein